MYGYYIKEPKIHRISELHILLRQLSVQLTSYVMYFKTIFFTLCHFYRIFILGPQFQKIYVTCSEIHHIPLVKERSVSAS